MQTKFRKYVVLERMSKVQLHFTAQLKSRKSNRTES